MTNKKAFTSFLILFILTSCLYTPSQGTRDASHQKKADSPQKVEDDKDSNWSQINKLETVSPRVLLTQIVDPETSYFKNKVSIPKNYNGFLYIAGLNLETVADKHLKVIFKFGRDREPIEIPATISMASGLTPDSSIRVLTLDMSERPFSQIRLLYDLYDYSDVNEEKLNSDKDIYCRGLRIEDDPTFNQTAQNPSCDQTNERCFYAYAKVKDSGLYKKTAMSGVTQYVSTAPSEPQMDISKTDFSLTKTNLSDLLVRNTALLKKCLPNNGKVDYYVESHTSNLFSSSTDFYGLYLYPTTGRYASLGQTLVHTIENDQLVEYVYWGPYRNLHESSWEISGDAIYSSSTTSYGIYDYFESKDNKKYGFNSFLYPRATKLNINPNVDHYSSDISVLTTSQLRTKKSLSLFGGDTTWMDGCNKRVTNYDSYTGEGIQSCNVTAQIELVGIDNQNKESQSISLSSEIKLQLLRSSKKDYAGRELIYQSMKACTSSRTCGDNECCYNQRCWSKEVVSKCPEESTGRQNLDIGKVCSSDFECTSLCCNGATGRCAVHNNTFETPVLCSKNPGESCVASEWCRKENVKTCIIVSTGKSVDRKPTCSLRCYNVVQTGNCIDSYCVSPEQPSVPSFNPYDPDCSGAQAPPLPMSIPQTSQTNN